MSAGSPQTASPEGLINNGQDQQGMDPTASAEPADAKIIQFPYNPDAPVPLTVPGLPESSVPMQDGSEAVTPGEALHGLAFALGLRRSGNHQLDSYYIADHAPPTGGLSVYGILIQPDGYKRKVKVEIDDQHRPMSERAITWFGAKAVTYREEDYQRILGEYRRG